MKKSEIATYLLLGFGILAVTSCSKNASTPPKAEVLINKTQAAKETAKETVKETTKEENKIEIKVDTIANHNVKKVKLRQAEEFAILAHSSITSTPSSTITGKVGLKPGNRSQIKLDSSEVTGGSANILAGDDADISNAAYILKAKIDLINSYNETMHTITDSDKVDQWNGNIGNKILSAGIYEWKSGVTIPLDLKLEGNDTDVWIFKIKGQLRIGTDVHVTLSGGAKASNVFWIVGDDVLIKARSSMVGTIFSQKTFEMKEQASLIGRAFVKNDKLILNKNIITKP